jgi:hypothetical protein
LIDSMNRTAVSRCRVDSVSESLNMFRYLNSAHPAPVDRRATSSSPRTF